MFTSLAEVIARRTPVEWFEGVAIVQALTRALLDGPAGGCRGVPDPASIMVTSEGDIVLTGGAGGDGNPVSDVGRLLKALVPPEAMPVPLRLVAAEAMAVPPLYPGPQELMQALQYFERPDLRQTIATVYLRWLRLPPEELEPPPSRPKAQLPSPQVPLPPSPLPQSKAPAGVPNRRLVVGAALLAALVLVGLPSWWTWSRPQHGWLGPTAARVSAVAAAARRELRELGLSSAAAPVGTSSANADAAPKPGASGTSNPVPRTHPRAPRRQPTPAPPATTVGPVAAPIEETAEDTTVYSADDRDVTPPVPLRVYQPSAPPPGVRAEDLPLVDVVVSPSGEVELVRLLRRPSDVRATAALSVVKAWRFHPATRNGRPVRYRLALQLTGR